MARQKEEHRHWGRVVLFTWVMLGFIAPVFAEFVTVNDVAFTQSSKFFDRRSGTYYTVNSAANTTGNTIEGPVRLVVESSTLSVLNADGTTSNGEPFFTISDSNSFSLSPGASTGEIRIEFERQRVALAYTLRLENDVPVDTDPPTLFFSSPNNGALLTVNKPQFRLSYNDPSGVDTSTLLITANDETLTVNCQLGSQSAQCTPTTPITDGSVQLIASIEDTIGNKATTQIQFEIDTAPVEISITSPEDGLITMAGSLAVTGTIGAGVNFVSVNGVAATISESTFATTVPLREGKNMLVALATKPSGRTGTDSIDVTRDIVAPIVRIDSPRDGFVSVEDKIAIAGKVNDIVNGATDSRVVVNGIEATVADGAFMVMDLPLVRGPNILKATATDAVGNVGTHSITITFQKPVGARISVTSGNGQVGFVKQLLPQPLVASVKDDLGNPVAGRVVTFEVTRNSGNLRIVENGLSKRIIQIPTDGSGQASVLFTLGDTAGEGNNRVKVTGQGVAGEGEFCASSVGFEPAKILMVMGDNQRGLAGHPLPTPFEALVIDIDGNPVKSLPVTFAVIKGSGNLNGEQSLVRMTGADGIARTVLTLGQEPGINNNVVNATFEGLTGLPATFTASALLPGNPQDTSFRGVVLDNGQTPIPGAVVSIGETDLSSTTDDQGQFKINNIPVGHIHLRIDPTNSPRPETFPVLEFETVTVAGQVNHLGQPILIPALQTEGSKIVGGNEDVMLTMPGVEGLTLTVFANSVTFADGSKMGQVTISQVHLDKVPMPPPSGTFFMPPAWTVQPAGTQFDPPARITIPNDGLLPGRVIDIFQFDHELNQFINIGKGTVSEDGSVITSDPGFGITRAGWGGCGQPQPPQTCASSCDDGNRCTMDSCVNGSCVNTPITTTPSAANMCEGCNNGTPIPKKTDAECCASERPGGGTSGYVVCCNATKLECVDPSQFAASITGRARTIRIQCNRVHERQHFGDIDCPTGAKECDTSRPNFKSGRSQADGECDAYKAERTCLQNADCMGDATCQGIVDGRIVFTRQQANSFKPGCIP